VRVYFGADGWDDYLYWGRSDANVHRRLNELIEDARRQPFVGLGKPEALRGDLSGWWSRRITAEHRLVYRVQGRKGEDQRLEILQCRYHYIRS
jgi:toxin YoeB